MHDPDYDILKFYEPELGPEHDADANGAANPSMGKHKAKSSSTTAPSSSALSATLSVGAAVSTSLSASIHHPPAISKRELRSQRNTSTNSAHVNASTSSSSSSIPLPAVSPSSSAPQSVFELHSDQPSADAFAAADFARLKSDLESRERQMRSRHAGKAQCNDDGYDVDDDGCMFLDHCRVFVSGFRDNAAVRKILLLLAAGGATRAPSFCAGGYRLVSHTTAASASNASVISQNGAQGRQQQQQPPMLQYASAPLRDAGERTAVMLGSTAAATHVPNNYFSGIGGGSVMGGGGSGSGGGGSGGIGSGSGVTHWLVPDGAHVLRMLGDSEPAARALLLEGADDDEDDHHNQKQSHAAKQRRRAAACAVVNVGWLWASVRDRTCADAGPVRRRNLTCGIIVSNENWLRVCLEENHWVFARPALCCFAHFD